MSTTQIVLLASAASNVVLGLFVFLQNPARRQNRQFAVFSINVAFWALGTLMVISVHSTEGAALFIRLTSLVAALILSSSFLLCLSIVETDFSWRRALRRHPLFFLANVLFASLTFFPTFLVQVQIAGGIGNGTMPFPEARYGLAFSIFNLYIIAGFSAILWSFLRGLATASGVQRTELQYVFLGILFSLGIAIPTNILIPIITGSSQMQTVGPISGLAMCATIAYGIATRRIMGAAELLRRMLAYGLLTTYLLMVFFLTHLAIYRIVPEHSPAQQLTASLIAAVIIALSMAPAQAFMRRVADWLFASSRQARLASAVETLTASLQTVSTMPELLGSFVDTIATLTGTQRVLILLARKRQFDQVFPPSASGLAMLSLGETTPIPRFLEQSARPIVADELLRERPTADIQALRVAMREASAAMAIGITSRNRLIGILMLGARSSGRIFGTEDQHNLQVVCNHLGVAIENAQLYTESIQHRLHSITLLNNLVNGVVAIDADGEVTMINREAQRICRLTPPEGQTLELDNLPPPIADALRRTLRLGAEERDLDAEIAQPDATPMPVRVGSSPLHDPDGKITGALAVLSDQTTVRRLESQIRRTDRLASVGTLAAGMAHEIKNPLVTISTFTQLLPDRYQDPEFRGTFTELVQHEIKRMNGLVNQLLRFARPTPALLAPMRVVDVLDHSLLLMEQQFRNQRIQTEKHFEAPDAVIRADANQLEQAFVNLLLNAIQAMQPEGRLTVWARPVRARNLERLAAAAPGGSFDSAVEITIRDTGCGISPEHLFSIFDPFFTTRSEGTGLGLSVAHGIISENRGTIEVASQLGGGTTFTITFPMVTGEQAA